MHAHNKLSSSLTFAHLKASHKGSQRRKPGPKPSCGATSDFAFEHRLLNSHFSFSTGQASPADLCCHHPTKGTDPTRLAALRLLPQPLTRRPGRWPCRETRPCPRSSLPTFPRPLHACCSASLHSPLEPHPAIPTTTH